MLMVLACTTGCKNFFAPNNSTTGGGTTVNSGDYAFVVNSNTSGTSPVYTLSGFSVGAATLTSLSGFPLTLPFAPTTVVVTPANSFLYVAGAGVIYGYTIGTGGALTQILSSTNSAALVNVNVVSMDVSPDGQWLIALDATTTIPTIDTYQIGSTGQLTVEPIVQYPFQGDAIIVPNTIRIAPTGTYVAAALGTGGDVLFSFDTTTGALTAVIQVNTLSASSADQALAFDATASTLYIARSGTAPGVYPQLIGTTGTLTQVSGAPFALGTSGTTFGPSSMVIDATGKYLYVGDRTNSTISGFSIGTGGVLTALNGSPYSSGNNIDALARDNSGDYILATASGGGPDLEMFSFDSTFAGKLDVATTASTGDPTEPAGAMAIALTH
jgi:6-phosphogluconolactonase (cycloisomerase 2 family)